MAPFGIRLDHCLVGELVVLPDQFVGSVVFIGDRSRPLGDRGYVPVVVVGLFVGVVAAILITSPRSSETVSISNEIVKKAATSLRFCQG